MTPFEEIMIDKVGESWFKVLRNTINSESFGKLAKYVAYVRQSQIIYPESEDLFRAYKLCPFNNVKVVILGQDPYYDGTANGLAFGYKNGEKPAKYEKSLDIIFQELEADVKFGLYLDNDYDLGWLAQQGVLLLNTVLSVKRNEPRSHKGLGWEQFTGNTIAALANDLSPKVFMLWGIEAKNAYHTVVKHYGITNKHLVLEAKHPAADLHNKDQFGNVKPNYPETFLGCKHFSQCDKYLNEWGIKSIRW